MSNSIWIDPKGFPLDEMVASHRDLELWEKKFGLRTFFDPFQRFSRRDRPGLRFESRKIPWGENMLHPGLCHATQREVGSRRMGLESNGESISCEASARPTSVGGAETATRASPWFRGPACAQPTAVCGAAATADTRPEGRWCRATPRPGGDEAPSPASSNQPRCWLNIRGRPHG